MAVRLGRAALRVWKGDGRGLAEPVERATSALRRQSVYDGVQNGPATSESDGMHRARRLPNAIREFWRKRVNDLR
jgi:hypothetical protein